MLSCKSLVSCFQFHWCRMVISSDLTFCELRLMLLAKSWYMVTQRAPVGIHNLEKSNWPLKTRLNILVLNPKRWMAIVWYILIIFQPFRIIPAIQSWLYMKVCKNKQLNAQWSSDSPAKVETPTLQTVKACRQASPLNPHAAAAQLSLKVAAPYKPTTAARAPSLRPVLFAAGQLPGDTKDSGWQAVLGRQVGWAKWGEGSGGGRPSSSHSLNS